MGHLVLQVVHIGKPSVSVSYFSLGVASHGQDGVVVSVEVKSCITPSSKIKPALQKVARAGFVIAEGGNPCSVYKNTGGIRNVLASAWPDRTESHPFFTG